MSRPHPLPVPGVVLGPYPERSKAELPSAVEAVLRALWADLPWVAKARKRRLEDWASRVQVAMQTCPKFPGPAFREQLNQQRAEMARHGLDSDAALRVTAHVAIAAQTVTGLTLRPPQLMAVRVVLDGKMAEMPTGAGKTLATAMAAAVAALAGIPVHVLCANDYLAERDCKQLLPIFRLLGLSAEAVTGKHKRGERRAAYASNIVYCAARELVFDYLRDRMLPMPTTPGEDTGRVLRGLCMAIIDEADSVLIDEAVTPFILSESYTEAEQIALCQRALALADSLQAGLHFRIDSAANRVELSAAGRAHIDASFPAQTADTDFDAPASIVASATNTDAGSSLWAIPRYREELLQTALHATHMLRRDEHYLVREGKVMLIDATTGRVADGRAWSRGLQQMVELREGCQLSPATRVIAQITYPRLFPRYLRMGGLSGTLTEARQELLQAYGVDVQPVPTGFAATLRIAAPQMFASVQDRVRAVLVAVTREHARGRPVLIGTDSVAESERLSRLLGARNLPHQLLNARQDHREAELIAHAGQRGQITVATNMAGRGTDIQLGAEVAQCGGLHVISCQHNSARRIDRQLFGRAARQGQPGSAEVLLSLDEGLPLRHLSHLLRSCLTLCSRSGRPMPLVIAKAVIRYTQWREERRAQKSRARLREQDEHLRSRLHIGAAPE